MNNAVILQHSAAIGKPTVCYDSVDEETFTRRWLFSHAWLCAQLKFTSVYYMFTRRRSLGRLLLLTYAWLCMNGCDPVGILKVLEAHCATCGIVACEKRFIIFKPRPQTEEGWSPQASGTACFLVLSTPELYCSGHLRWEDGDMSYSHNCRRSISLKSLWRGKIRAS